LSFDFIGHLLARASAHDRRSGLLENMMSRMRCLPMGIKRCR
jgi:hypothetical protein